MTVIVDYGVGNLFSLKSSLASLGIAAEVSGDRKAICRAERIILPGVGAFGDAMAKLKESGLDKLLCQQAEEGKPLMGVCLGMQLLFERSFEFCETEGLGLLPGRIVPIAPMIRPGLKVPHIGWNALDFSDAGKSSPIFKYINSGDYVYFVHSFAAVDCGQSVLATAEYGGDLTAAVGQKNIFGMQFHPEKSGSVGLGILKAFCEM